MWFLYICICTLSIVCAYFLNKFILKMIYNGESFGDVFGTYKTIRKLGLLENFTALFQNYYYFLQTVHIIHVTGNIDINILKNAMVLLLKRHPALRMGVHVGPDGDYYFHEYNQPEKLLNVKMIERQNDEHWINVAEECNHEFRQVDSHNELLWRIVLLKNQQDSNGMNELLLITSHTICDGSSRAVLSGDILMCYSLAAQGKTNVAIEREQLSEPIEKLLTPDLNETTLKWHVRFIPKFIRMPIWIILELFMGGRYKLKLNYAPIDKRYDRILTCDMNNEQINLLLKSAKDQNLKLHGVLTAIAIMAYKRTFQLPANVPIGWQAPVKMRHWTKENMNQWVGNSSSHIDGHILPPSVDCETADIWKIANEIYDSIHTDFDKKAYSELWDTDCYDMVVPLRKILFNDKDECGRTLPISISNLGDQSQIQKQYIFTTADEKTAKLELCGWHSIQGQRALGPDIFIMLATYYNVMYISFVYTSPLFSEGQMKEFKRNFKYYWDLLAK